MTALKAPAGTIVVFSDLACPFTHVALHRLYRARTALGLDETVRVWNRAFPIELLNRSPGTRHGSDSEIPVLGTLEPDAGWQIWQGPDYHYPSTLLLAFEAVAAANAQHFGAGEALDAGLRRAFWADSRPIHLHHEILAVAQSVELVDVDQLTEDLRRGTHRARIFDDADIAATDEVAMSPHLFLPDGADYPNPGLQVRWQGAWASGFPVIESNNPSIFEQLVERAAATVE